MNLKKEVLFCVVFIFFTFLLGSISAMGVSPSVKKYNFEPGFEEDITYRVYDANPQRETELFVEGDLAEYVTLSKDSLMGGGEFVAHIRFPEKIEKPGPHNLYIGAREKIDPEFVRGNIGTSVVIKVLVRIFVPYPGRYIEIDLEGGDANVGDKLTFYLDVKSEGTETINITPKIDIFAGEGKVDTLIFSSRTIRSQEELGLKKDWDTTGFNPGNYKAVAEIDYGGLARDEFEFRVGSLDINILNYTAFFTIGGLKKFGIEVESGWNDNIDGVYADVSISNLSGIVESFKTTTTSLVPWEKKPIEGYFDTSKFAPGVYDANITLSYFGKETGKSKSANVKVSFVKGKSLTIWYIIGGAGIFLIVALLLIKKFLLKSNGKKRRSKK